VDGNCQYKPKDSGASVVSWSFVTITKNETEMQAYVASTAPISICADASTWQFYVGGVIKFMCGDTLDHCIQITGYGPKADGIFGDVNAWAVRNSWGADWGESGYLYIEVGKNLCGIADVVTTVVTH